MNGCCLEPLELVVDAEGGVGVVEADDEAEADLVLAHRVDEAAARLLVLGAPAQRPAEGVDDPVERLRDLPDLLHPELPGLRVGAVHVEVVVGGVGEVADRALGEHGRLRDHVGAGLEVAELLAVLAAAAIAGADALDDPVLDQELGRGGLGEDVDARLFGFLGEEAAEFGDRERVGALFAEVGRRRLQRERFLRGEEVGRVLRHLLVDRRPIGRVEVGEQLGSSPRGRRWRPRAGGRRRLSPSRSPRPGLRRASRSAPARPRAAASV